MLASHDDPDKRIARRQRRATFDLLTFHPQDPDIAATLRAWDWVARSLLSRGVQPQTRTRLEDSRRIVGELSDVLAGREEGEGTADRRTIHAAVQAGRIQAVVSIIPCPRAAFVELLATAPWNLLGPGDPPDSRSVRGAGSALIAHAVDLSHRSGAGGQVSLQAENPRSLELYERLGFVQMRPSDAPLALVPRGEHGWSPSILRLARGEAGPEEARAPWMLLDPSRANASRAYASSAAHSLLGRAQRLHPAPA